MAEAENLPALPQPTKPERASSGRLAMFFVPIIGIILSFVVSGFLGVVLLSSSRIESSTQVDEILRLYQGKLTDVNHVLSTLQVIVRPTNTSRITDFTNITKKLGLETDSIAGVYWIGKNGADYALRNQSESDLNTGLLLNLFKTNPAFLQARNEAMHDRLGIMLNIPGQMLGSQFANLALFIAANHESGEENYLIAAVNQLFPPVLQSTKSYVTDLEIYLPGPNQNIVLYKEHSTAPIIQCEILNLR